MKSPQVWTAEHRRATSRVREVSPAYVGGETIKSNMVNGDVAKNREVANSDNSIN